MAAMIRTKGRYLKLWRMKFATNNKYQRAIKNLKRDTSVKIIPTNKANAALVSDLEAYETKVLNKKKIGTIVSSH